MDNPEVIQQDSPCLLDIFTEVFILEQLGHEQLTVCEEQKTLLFDSGSNTGLTKLNVKLKYNIIETH